MSNETTDREGAGHVPETAGDFVSDWGEGPVWWEGALWHVDIEGHMVVRFDPASAETESWDVGERVGTVVPRAGGPGLVIAGDNGFAFFDPATGQKSPIADPEPDKKPDNRFNDGKCDPAGRFWAGTISLTKKSGTAALYRLDPDLAVHRILPDITTSNGIGWTADGRTLYYIDTPTKVIRAFAFDPQSGAVSDSRIAVDTAALGIEGSPDGLAVDVEGCVWVAICHGGVVVRFDPRSGKEVGRVSVPCVETTACAFGGAGRRDLYITTGIKDGLHEPLAGRLFVVRDIGVAGVPASAFAG
ncbi:SMP-30/gluconolactonase/LRE family protein [soil metagenome]